MKKSKFNNIIKSKNNEYFVYNSFSNSFIKVDQHVAQCLDNDKDAKNIHKLISKDDYVALKNSNFIYNDDKAEEELELERLYLYQQRCNNKSILNLSILPTLRCNFNCSYCYESSRPNIKISSATKKNIIKLIESQEQIKTLTIQWYGGEPLLEFDEIVEITNNILNVGFIRKNGVEIVSDLTTNGYLLDEKKITKLNDLFIKTIQITLDGLEATHNKRRPHIKNKDSFKTIIDNLEKLVKIQPKIVVHLRVNVDGENKDEFPKLFYFLNRKFGSNKNFHIYPGFVQDTSACNTGSGCTLDTENQLKFKLEMFHRYNINLGYYPFIRDNICMAQHVNSFVIDPKGNVFKCWLDIGKKDRIVSNINGKGMINGGVFIKYLVSCNPYYDSKCQKCRIFPICGGGCQHDRIENKYYSGIHNICSIYKEGLDKLLLTHYSTKKI